MNGVQYYHAPEYFKISNDEDSINDYIMKDCWSLGIILYYIEEKSLPYTIEELTKYKNSHNQLPPLNLNLKSPLICYLVEHLLKINPKDRITL